MDYVFYSALAHVAAGERETAAAHRARLAAWNENAPKTFADRLALVDAELARLDGRVLDAARAYERAIDLSRRGEYVHHMGLACELAARFYAELELHSIATAHLRRARHCFQRWGADGKVADLDVRHPELLGSGDAAATATSDTSLQTLDLATVMKVSEAISGEIVLDKLLQRLMTLAVEHAGAGRGLLILSSSGEHWIAAEAIAGTGAVTVHLRRSPIEGELPESVFNYVARSHDRVILDDASRPSPFSGDEYLGRVSARSVLCLPLVKQGALIGVLYLENHLMPRVFTADRVSLLELIVSMAAISLDHARLYSDLQDAGLFLEEAQRLSHTGSFAWNPATGDTVLSGETYNILGFDRGLRVPHDLAASRVHPDDREAWLATVERAAAVHVDFEIEHRLLLPDGTIKHVTVVARAVSGRCDGIAYLGAVVDITAAKRAEETMRLAEQARALAKANERLELALTGSNVAIWEYDVVGRDGIDDSAWHPERCHPDDLGRVYDAVRAHLAGKTSVLELESRFRHTDGRYLWWLTRGKVMRDAAGRPTRLIGTSVDITDRKRLEGELSRVMEDAKAANRAKDQFMANVSHEIRTPMNAILGMTEIVLDTPLSPDQQLSMSTVKSAAQNLLAIIDDLLDFAKIEAGKLALVEAPMSLREGVYDTLRALAVQAHVKGVELICDVDPEVPDTVIGDAGRLRQILLNLVGNAIKFTARGEILVRIDLDGPLLRFVVRDTGIGIPRDKLDVIFQAFEQADASTTRRYGGTGLGLSIATRLVALMGGTMSVTSEVGQGSAFTFTARLATGDQRALDRPPPAGLSGQRALIASANATSRAVLERWLTGWGMAPTAVADGTEALSALRAAAAAGRPYAVALVDARIAEMGGPALAAMPIVLLVSADRSGATVVADARVQKPVRPDELYEALCAAVGAREVRTAPVPTSRPTATRTLRVLVAEDDELNQRLMRMLLGKRGHLVTVARTGREALALVEAQEFDVLLLDMHLPEMDGLEVVRAIRRRERGTSRHQRTIALTARSRDEDRDACLAAGMDDFLSKPMSAARLWEALDDRLPDAPSASLVHARTLLETCGDDAAILETIARVLSASLPSHLTELTRALGQRKWPEVRAAAHQIAGMVAPFSSKLRDLASELEDRAARGDSELEASALVSRLVSLAPELMREVGEVSLGMLRRRAG